MHQDMLLTAQVHLSELILGPSIISSSDLLSWPQGTEFVDLYLKFSSFHNLLKLLFYNNLDFC